MSSILIITFAIIYIYMLKILITWNIPSNHIFRIISLLFVFGMPFWTMINSFDGSSILVKICKKLPLAFMPLIILQIYSLMLRISSNGLTVIRYIGIMLIIIEILYAIIYIIKEDKIYYLGYIIIIMCIIGILVPKINAIDASINNQYKIVTKLLTKKALTAKEHSKLYSSYNYIKDFKEGKKLLEDLTKEQIEYIEEAKEVECDCYYSSVKDLYNAEVIGYKKISKFEITSYEEKIDFEDLRAIDVKGHKVDFYSYVNHFLKSQKEDYLKYTDIIIGDDYKIYVNDIQVCVEDSKLNSYTIDGYILEK